MRIKKLTLRNFRNIRSGEMEPSPRLNFLVGLNGQGKTSFLEAISFLSTLRSFREAKAQEVLQWGQLTGDATAQVAWDAVPGISQDLLTTLKVAFESQNERVKKAALINDKVYRNSTAYLSQRFGQLELGFHSIVFNPSDHDLVRGDPGTRRRYLDRVLSAESLDYLDTLTRYQRLLDQRNAVLKDPEPREDLLLDFTEPWVALGARLVRSRIEWLLRATPALGEITPRIAPEQPPMTLSYEASWVPSEGGKRTGLPLLPSLEDLEQSFWKHLNLFRKAELRAGHSLVGPHRDDWGIQYGGKVLKGHGSQGEVRTALLALKLTELGLFRNKTGHRPVFLLDDLSSELDETRRGFLMSHLLETDLQVFVTTTDETLESGNVFKIHGGVCLEKARYDDRIDSYQAGDVSV